MARVYGLAVEESRDPNHWSNDTSGDALDALKLSFSCIFPTREACERQMWEAKSLIGSDEYRKIFGGQFKTFAPESDVNQTTP